MLSGLEHANWMRQSSVVRCPTRLSVLTGACIIDMGTSCPKIASHLCLFVTQRESMVMYSNSLCAWRVQNLYTAFCEEYFEKRKDQQNAEIKPLAFTKFWCLSLFLQLCAWFLSFDVLDPSSPLFKNAPFQFPKLAVISGLHPEWYCSPMSTTELRKALSCRFGVQPMASVFLCALRIGVLVEVG